MREKGKILKFPPKLDFPHQIFLNKLEGEPKIIDIPIYFGIDTATVRIIDFTIICDFYAIIRFTFDIETYKYESIDMYFEGMEYLTLEEYDEFYYQKLREEFSVICQANEILMGHKELSEYQEALEGYLECNFDKDVGFY